jgi:hypothetical protein
METERTETRTQRWAGHLLKNAWMAGFFLAVSLCCILGIAICQGHEIHQLLNDIPIINSTIGVVGLWVTIAFGFLGWFGSIVAEAMQNKMKNGLESLHKVNTDLGDSIKNLEEVVRLRLRGIPEILGRAIYILDNVADDLFIVTFTVRFGAVHIPAFGDQADRNIVTVPVSGKRFQYEEACSEYWRLMKECIGKVKTFRLLTVPDDALNNFFGELKKRKGYELFDIDRALADVPQCWHKIDRSHGSRDNHLGSAEFRQIDQLPFQMILARLQPDAKGSERMACLVYLVGSYTAQHSSAASGFYTELEDFIDIFKNVGEDLFRDAARYNPVANEQTPVRKE